MSAPERRPRFKRGCPVPGCGWEQVTAWFVGSPDVTEEVTETFLRIEAETHLLSAHFTPDRRIFV